MREIQKVITIIVGVVVLYVFYNFWFGSGIFAGWFVPPAPEGFDSLNSALNAGNPAALRSAGTADLISQALEILATIVSTVGTLFIAIAFRLIAWLSSPFESAVNSFANGPTEVTNTVNTVDVKEYQPIDGFETYMQVLAQAAIDGDVKMCGSVLNKIHQSDFIIVAPRTAKEVEELTPGGFPVVKGGE